MVNLYFGYPVIYRGEDPQGGIGHAFICDGYTNDDFFHFNFGEYGFNEGVFKINDIVDSIANFSSSQAAVFNIHPSYSQYYCDFSLPLATHYYYYYEIEGNTTPAPYLNVPKTFTTLTSVYNDPTYPTSWRTIPNGATSEYIAHKEVILLPGFTAEAGSNFVAKIVPCSSCEEEGRENRSVLNSTRYSHIDLSEIQARTSELKDQSEIKHNDGIILYPNPTTGQLNIQLSDSQDIISKVEITNILGNKVLQSEMTNSQLDVSSLRNGIYILKVTTKQGKMLNAKFVKQ